MGKSSKILILALLFCYCSCTDNLHHVVKSTKSKNKYIGKFLNVETCENECNSNKDSVHVEIFSTINNVPLTSGHYEIDVEGHKSRHYLIPLKGSKELIKVHHTDCIMVYLEGTRSNMFAIISNMQSQKCYGILFKADSSIFKRYP